MSIKTLSLTAFFALSGMASYADVVTDWNLVTVKATKVAKYDSNLSTRIEAIEAIAVYDAVNSIKNISKPYHYFSKPHTESSAQAAAAQAAHDVLVNYFPDQRAVFDTELQKSLAAITDGPVGDAVRIGAGAAADIITLRNHDGSENVLTYANPEHPEAGHYVLTPAKFAPGVDQQWGKIKPFLLNTSNQFRPVAPPALASANYRKALEQVGEIGAANSTTRTVDQTHIAQFYKQDAELTVNEAARVLALNHHTSLEQNALIFLLTDIAEADARIAIWDAKYTFLFWRPVTSLNADSTGSVSNNYQKWTPLISTPPHPSYPCGHCGTVEAGFEVLKTFFGNDNTIELHTTTDNEPARTVTSLTNGEYENAWSRLYGGIHYSFDIEAATTLGNQVAAYILSNGPKSNLVAKNNIH